MTTVQESINRLNHTAQFPQGADGTDCVVATWDLRRAMLEIETLRAELAEREAGTGQYSVQCFDGNTVHGGNPSYTYLLRRHSKHYSDRSTIIGRFENEPDARLICNALNAAGWRKIESASKEAVKCDCGTILISAMHVGGARCPKCCSPGGTQ